MHIWIKKTVLLVCMALLSFVVLCGCGNTEDGSTDSPDAVLAADTDQNNSPEPATTDTAKP